MIKYFITYQFKNLFTNGFGNCIIKIEEKDNINDEFNEILREVKKVSKCKKIIIISMYHCE